MERSSEIARAVEQIYESISNGDGDAVAASLSKEDGVLFIGTDPDEWFSDAPTLQEMLQAQAAAGIKVKAGAIQAHAEGSVGWAADQGTFILPDGAEVPFRITVVFHQEDGAWKVVQEHASVAVSNEEAVGTAL